MNQKRPYVTVKKENKLEDLLRVLEENLPKFKEFEGIAGIMLDGGMSRGYADHLSEIDVVVFVHKEAYQRYQASKTPVCLGITMLSEYLFDVKLLDYEEEVEREYDSIALWDLSYAKILFDPNGELRQLFDSKLNQKSELGQAEGLMFHVWWHFQLAANIWIHREDALQGHYCLNDAVKPILSALYIANDEYIPHDKWLIHMSRTLEWKPEQYEELLSNILSTGDMSLNSLRIRQQSLECLWKKIDKRMCEMTHFDNGLALMQRGTYQKLERILEKQEFTMEEWTEFGGLSDINYEPFYSFVTMNQDKIMIDHEKIKMLSENELYSWFYEVVKAVLNEDRC